MAIVKISDPNGTKRDFFEGNWFTGQITSYSHSQLVITDTDGNEFSLYGDLSSLDTSEWQLTRITLSQENSFSADLSQLDISYNDYESNNVFDVIFNSHDQITSNSPASFQWNLNKGNDTINTGPGNDTVNGDQGLDTLIIDDTIKKSKFFLNIDTPTIISADGTDELNSIEIIEFDDRRAALATGSFGDNFLVGNQRANITRHDIMLGGDGEDRIIGKSGRDTIRGEHGHDTLKGGHGSDKLYGGLDDDKIFGGSGNDKIFGQKGDDVLTGGKQSDLFVFKKGDGNDTIKDFSSGADKIAIGKGAKSISDLEFNQSGSDVLISFSNVTILLEDNSISELQSSDNFLF